MIQRMVLVGALVSSLAFAACGGTAMTVDGLADRTCTEIKAALAKPEGEQAAAITAAMEKAGKDGETNKLDPEAFGAAMLAKCGTEFMQAAAMAG